MTTTPAATKPAAPAASRPAVHTGLTGAARAAALVTLCLTLVAGYWMVTTEISGAVIASGQAVVRGKPKVIQSLDGGIVQEILVADGDVVEAGQVLMRLDPTLLLINLDIYRNRLAETLARESRLQAEYADAAEIVFPTPPATLPEGSLDRHVVGQTEIFRARKEVLAGRVEQLEERILQFRNQIDGVEGRIAASQEQLRFTEKELKTAQSLYDDGLAREAQVLEVQRAQSALLGRLSEEQSELARIRNSIRDTELEILQARRQFREDVVTELREATAQREELELQIVTLEKQLERIDIIAPASGVMHEMQVTTAGGVVAPEAVIAQVVPLEEGVEFEVRVDPRSIDQIYVGQQARVVFPTFDMRTTPEIFGTLATVPPSSVTDPATGQSYYRVVLRVPPEELDRLGDVDLIPGMPIEAFLQTGERSVLSYLTKPLTDQLHRAFRDG